MSRNLNSSGDEFPISPLALLLGGLGFASLVIALEWDSQYDKIPFWLGLALVGAGVVWELVSVRRHRH